MKQIYSLYAMAIGLVLASAFVLANPPIALERREGRDCSYQSDKCIRLANSRFYWSPVRIKRFSR